MQPFCLCRGLSLAGALGGGRHLEAPTSVCLGTRVCRRRRAIGRRPGRNRCLVYVFAVYVHGIADESGALLAIAGVPLFKAVQLQLRLNLLE